MRLIRLTTDYPAYLAALYARRRGLADKPYAQQYEEIVEDAFGWADFWTHALSRFGYETWEPIANAELLQKAWAQELDLSFSPDQWMHEITLAQVRAFRPDIVFIDDYAAFDAQFVRRLRDMAPSVRLVLGWCAAPYADESVFGAYDVVLTSIPGAAEYFRRKGLRSEVIPHAFEPRILGRLDLDRHKQHAFTFIGSIRPGAPHLLGRQTLLRELAKRGGLELFADVPVAPANDERVAGVRDVVRRILRGMTSGRSPEEEDVQGWRQLEGKHHPARFGLDMFQTLRDSAVTFNAHSGFHGEWASNMRLYEATGVGSCLLTDWKHNLKDLFEPDKEVVVYRNVAECLEKARWLLSHPRERDAVARAGQLRTLSDHTFERRAEMLDEAMRRHLRRAA